MSNFATEKDLQRSFDERTDLLKQTIIALKVSIQSRRALVISALNELSDQELNGQALPAAKIQLLQKNHDAVEKQVVQLARFNSNFNSLQNEFASILERYRELKGSEQNAIIDSVPPALEKTQEAAKQ
jgi:hypothetical protein